MCEADLGEQDSPHCGYACFHSSQCVYCSLGLRVIKEVVLCVSFWVPVTKFFGAVNASRKIRRFGEVFRWHYCQVARWFADILSVHLHSLIGLIATGVDCVVSVGKAPTAEWSRQHHWCVHNCRSESGASGVDFMQ